MVLLGTRVLDDDPVDQLPDFGFQPDFTALAADQGRHVFKLVELVAPRLLVCDVLALQRPFTPGAAHWVRHDYSFLRVHGSTQRLGSYRWTVMISITAIERRRHVDRFTPDIGHE